MEEAARHVKVVLDGQGADELLAGYSRYVFPYVADRILRRPAPGGGGLVRELSDLGRIESRSRLWFLARTPLPAVQRSLGRPPWLAPRVLRREFARTLRRVSAGARAPVPQHGQQRRSGTSCAARACPRCCTPRTR